MACTVSADCPAGDRRTRISRFRHFSPTTAPPFQNFSAGGIYNTHFWIDPEKQIAAALLMQTLPFYDEAALRVLRGFEREVYRHLR